MPFSFQVRECVQSDGSRLRLGQLCTAHGEVPTPLFMPVGTAGTVKGVLPKDLLEMGAHIILGNTYHLYLRPGHGQVKALGGLHRFMAWERPILTDSGGFQVFSLAKLRKINSDGVQFQSHIDGSSHFLTPELSIEIQEALGSDIMMAFDDCPKLPATPSELRQSMELTLNWEKRSLWARKSERALFAIVQGGLNESLRCECLLRLQEFESSERQFEGFALGGLSVGEPIPEMYELVTKIAPQMPSHKPRYLMGVGTPEDLLTCIGQGIDLFDCVMPTRNARNGMLFTSRGEIRIPNARWKDASNPPDEKCGCYTCRHFSMAYIRHLYQADEMLGPILGTIHNLHYYLSLLSATRSAIEQGTFPEFSKWTLEARKELNYASENSPSGTK